MTILSEETINKLVEMSRRYPKRFRGLPERIPPNDRRLHEVRHQDTLVEMPNYRSLDEWRACADWLRRHVLVSNGLWPIPERTPLNPAVFGRIERDEYSVEKVYFESFPGFFVTGNLYRPLDRALSTPQSSTHTVIGPTDGCRMTMPAPSPPGASASPGRVTWPFRTI